MKAETIRSQQPAGDATVTVEWRAKGWTCLESARIVSAESQGASLALNKRPEVGQLVCLTFPPVTGEGGVPRRQKTVWALVWAVTSGQEEKEEAPRRKPKKSYDDLISVLYLEEDGTREVTQMWADRFVYAADPEGKFSLLREAGEDEWVPANESRRRESRLELPFVVMAEVIGENGEVLARETAVTENVSRGGAALRTALEINPQRIVRLTITEKNLVLNSVVRAFRVGQDGVTRAHLKFTDGEWPLESF